MRTGLVVVSETRTLAARIESLIREVLADIEPAIESAFRAVDHRPALGSALDQVGLLDGPEIVVEYLEHGEHELALDHLLYMILEPPLRITADTFYPLRTACQLLGRAPDEVEQLRQLVWKV